MGGWGKKLPYQTSFGSYALLCSLIHAYNLNDLQRTEVNVKKILQSNRMSVIILAIYAVLL